MRNQSIRWLAVSCAVFFSSAAWAAPPASCASKFVGTWTYPGGMTIVRADGTAYPKCPNCVPMQTWTCRGNTYLFSNAGPPGQFSATLIDANRMQGSGIIATRTGAAASKRSKR